MNSNYGFSWFMFKVWKEETVMLYPTNMFNVSGGRIYLVLPKNVHSSPTSSTIANDNLTRIDFK